MKLLRNIPLLLALSFMPQQVHADVVSTFDTSLDGWTGSDEVTHSSTGGNPGGFALHTDSSSSGNSIFAPVDFLGNWNAYSELRFDHRIIDAGDQAGFRDYDVGVTSSSGTLFWSSDAASSATGWTRFVIPIKESAWTVDGVWSDIISDVTELRIRIELVSNNSFSNRDVSGIDNVQLRAVPEPSSVVFLVGVSFTTLLRLRRRSGTTGQSKARGVKKVEREF